MAGIRRGTRFLARAGTNALFAYVLAPFVCSAIDAAFEATGRSLTYAGLAPGFGIGLARGLTLAFGLTWLAGFLKDKGLDLRLGTTLLSCCAIAGTSAGRGCGLAGVSRRPPGPVGYAAACLFPACPFTLT